MAALAFLAGCQGTSVGGGTNPPSSGTLSLAKNALNFGNVAAGSSKTLSATVTNSGSALVKISAAAVSSSSFSMSGANFPLTVAPAQSVTLNVTFSPKSAANVSGSITLSSDASNSTVAISLSGTGVADLGQLTVTPSSLNLGSVAVGSSGTASGTLTASGASVMVTAASTNDGSVFAVKGLSLPVTIPAGQSISFTIAFTPKTAGVASATLSVTSDASNSTLTLPLSGTGVANLGQLTVSPSTMDLGSVVVGSSGTASGTLTASGTSVMVTAASTNNSSVFAVSGLSLPVSIAAGKSVPFTITFSPKTAGAASATLTVTSDASNSSATESLKGTGTAAATHSVNLSWDASSSPNISGYNVYRAAYSGSCGSFSKINSMLDTGTLYTDTTVIGGTSYCYGVRAVNTSGNESTFSNVVKNVKIPSP